MKSFAIPGGRAEVRPSRSRRGSALLIVLGMLAFMIVSAVAFSAYMRYSRLPSSYLRRTAASRQLVKAALARAIDEIDASIGNNPHPGLGTAQTRYPRNTDEGKGAVGQLRERNIWLHRVFFGSDNAVSVNATVSPLTLEALAYIPPPLVNDARYLSRRSPAAAWKSLGFDAGRYSFCALDVSDYFDINRMTANMPRSSAGNRRVSLAYLFENDAHTSPGSDAESWEEWMKNFRKINDDSEFEWSGSVAPFVSVADFNLAFGQKGGIGKMTSPFYKFIQDGNRNTFYPASSDADYDRLSRMTFVTDGLFPSEDEKDAIADGAYDLSDPKYQPFKIDQNGKSGPSISELLMGSAHHNEATMAWHKRLGGVGLAALYDYLDPDHVPVSLAVPTTERVPMICGVQPVLNGAKLKVMKAFEYPDNNGQNGNGDDSTPSLDTPPRKVEQIVHYRIDPNQLNLMGGAVNVVYAYPFSRGVAYSESFKLDGRLSFFFSTEKMGLRTNNNNPTEVLHIADKGTINSGVDANGLMNVALAGDMSVDMKNAKDDEKDAVKDITLPFMAGGAAELGLRLQGESKLLSIKYVWEQKPTKVSGNTGGVGGIAFEWAPKFDKMVANQSWEGSPEYTSDLCIVNDKGVRQTDIGDLVSKGKTLFFNVAVWLRVKQGGSVVDMVPACLGDDTIESSSGKGPNAFDMLNGGEFGAYYPLLRFDTGGNGSNISMVFSQEELDKLASGETTPPEINLWPKAALVADPRFNHAPENWFSYDGNLNVNAWLDKNHASDEGRDGDIFMEVSDNGYLQSKYELAMLPACGHLKNTGSAAGQGRMKLFSTYSGKSLPSSFGATVQGDFMWKTYDPIDTFADEFYGIKWVGDRKGYRVCPYSDSVNVIMAAFANTPLNWACAGTNDVENAVNFEYSDPKKPDGAGFNKEYAWNAYSSGGKFAWKDLVGVAENFISKVHAKNGDWEEAWDSLGWYDDSGKKFCGVTLTSTDELWNVDRKFLYGYWKECFAAKQQLFLVFVRAEPVMMGGDGINQIPPQLGARAVALVWRNPATKKRNGDALADDTPHQTRVLFYRHLD